MTNMNIRHMTHSKKIFIRTWILKQEIDTASNNKYSCRTRILKQKKKYIFMLKMNIKTGDPQPAKINIHATWILSQISVYEENIITGIRTIICKSTPSLIWKQSLIFNLIRIFWSAYCYYSAAFYLTEPRCDQNEVTTLARNKCGHLETIILQFCYT